MAEDDQCAHGGSKDTEQDSFIQEEQPSTPKVSRGISSPGSSGEVASLSLAATAAPAPGQKKPGYYSENGGYLMELSSQQRLRIQQEIKKKFKPGTMWLGDNLQKVIFGGRGIGVQFLWFS